MSNKQIRARLKHHDNRYVKNCIIIRREGENRDGAFYYVTVAKNGLYLNKVLTGSNTATSAVMKMRAERKMWSDEPVMKQVWYDYPHPRNVGAYIKI